MGETFKLNFITNGEGIKTINEPTGFDSVPFTFKQDEKRYGRDKFFGGDNENEFTFYRMLNHEFETLLYYHETYGWEAEVKLIIEKDGIDNIIGDLDFKYAETDQLEYFKCKIIQDTNEATLKRRSELEVNVFNDEDFDGNEITPLNPQNILVKAKPITQASSWETPNAFIERFSASDNDNPGGVTMTNYFKFNPAINLKTYGIDNSLTFFEPWQKSPFSNGADFGSDFKIIEAVNNLKKVKINITNIDLEIDPSNEDGGRGYIDISLELRYGVDYETAQKEILFSKNGIYYDHATYTNSNDYYFEIPSLTRGESVWLHYTMKVRQSRQVGGGNRKINADTTINSMDVGITATSIAYNTIVPSVRLKDAVNQVVKSTSGLNTSFPFAEPNCEMHNQRLFNGNLLRNLTDRAFNIKFDDITDWLQEINGDYEVNGNTVFFGKYEDFYQNKEVGVFTDIRFDSFRKYMNERYAINQFSYKYKKYQSQKENEVANTFDIPHGDTQWNVQNRFVENKKEISVPFVRCSFYIDEQRRKAFDLNNDTSTQDDDTIFILDTKELNQDLTFTETDFLQHTYNTQTGYLKITNTGSFSWVLLGLRVSEDFRIIDDPNAGVYSLVEVTDRYIVINNGSGDESNNGERNTQFTYIVSTVTAPFISWSNEGFNYIDGITDSDNFANLKYTVKRNIRRFYNQYLATCNLFAKKPIKNTKYVNNGELSISYEGYQTVENTPFTPDSPILSPYMYDITIIADFNTFMSLQSQMKTDRGFVRFFDANGHVIKIYPKEMTFTKADEQGEIKIIGEGKHQTSLINIIYAGMGYLNINNEYRVHKLDYEVIGEKVAIKDKDGLLLYNPAYWHKITVNDANYETKEELIAALELLKQ